MGSASQIIVFAYGGAFYPWMRNSISLVKSLLMYANDVLKMVSPIFLVDFPKVSPAGNTAIAV